MPRAGLTKQVYYSRGPQNRRIEVVISRPAKVIRLSQSPALFPGPFWRTLGTRWVVEKRGDPGNKLSADEELRAHIGNQLL